MGLELGEVVQVVVMDHRGRRIDRADEQHVLNHVLHHTLADLLELGAGLVGRLERVHVGDQLLDIGRRLDAVGAVAVDPLCPQHAVTNTEVVLERRDPQLVVAKHDGQWLALAPHQNVKLVRGLCRTILVRGHFLHNRLDTDIGPVLGNEFDSLAGDALGGEVHVEDQLVAVRQLTEPVAVGILHAHRIKTRVRTGSVELGHVGLPLVGHKAGLRRETDILLRRALTEETDLVQLGAVDGQRHSFAEADITEDARFASSSWVTLKPKTPMVISGRRSTV